jgi:hypothetical protein
MRVLATTAQSVTLTVSCKVAGVTNTPSAEQSATQALSPTSIAVNGVGDGAYWNMGLGGSLDVLTVFYGTSELFGLTVRLPGLSDADAPAAIERTAQIVLPKL